MAQFPSMSLWTDAYLADTVHLRVAESGAYLHLLMSAWRTEDGYLPNDDKKLQRFAKCTLREWKQVRDVVMEFWTATEDGSHVFQKRLEKERLLSHSRASKASRAAGARWLKTKQTGSPQASPEHAVSICPSDAVSTTTVNRKKETPLPPLESKPEKPNGQAPPIGSLFDKNEHGDECVPFSSRYEASLDPAIEAGRIIEWYGRQVTTHFGQWRQPYPGRPNEGKRSDLEVAKGWVGRGFNAALAHAIFYETLAAKCGANEQPPRSLSFFEGHVAEFIAANPAMFSYRDNSPEPGFNAEVE